MISALVARRAQFRQPIMSPEKVSQAVIKQLVNSNGGQVVVPASYGLAALLRGFPNWLQERSRDRESQKLARLQRLQQESAKSSQN